MKQQNFIKIFTQTQDIKNHSIHFKRGGQVQPNNEYSDLPSSMMKFLKSSNTWKVEKKRCCEVGSWRPYKPRLFSSPLWNYLAELQNNYSTLHFSDTKLPMVSFKKQAGTPRTPAQKKYKSSKDRTLTLLQKDNWSRHNSSLMKMDTNQ